MEFENTSVETQEVAEPVESVETQEVAEPVESESSGKTSADSAFAEMRRARQEAERKAAEAERELAEFKAASEARREAVRRLTGSEDGDVSAIAESMGVDADDVLATLSAQEATAKKDLYIEQLEKQVAEVNAEKQFQADLIEVQKIDPTIEKLFDLGDTFLALREKGVDVNSAYWAAKAEKEATQMKAPKAPGKANTEQPEKSYFTEAEVDAMTPEQQRANADKILSSMKHWT